MKKILLLLLLMILGSGLVFTFYLLPQITTKTEAFLKQASNQEITIGSTNVRLDSVHFSNIEIDKDGFNRVGNINVKLNWLNYLLRKEINQIHIDEIKISSTTEELPNLLHDINNKLTNNIHDSHLGEIIIDKFIWDISSIYGPLRIPGTIRAVKNDKDYSFDITLNVKQHQLTFLSTINGTINQAGNIEFNIDIKEGKVNLYPLRFARTSGWISYKNDTLSGQIEAGKGNIFSLPLSNAQFTIGQQEEYYPLLMRANISGTENSHLSIDTHFSQDVSKQDFKLLVSLSNAPLLPVILEKENLDISSDIEILKLHIDYLKERRFADGPWPFNIALSHENQKAEGIFLFYGDKFDLRGSAEGDKDLITIMKSFLPHDKENELETLLRVDQNLKPILLKNIQG